MDPVDQVQVVHTGCPKGSQERSNRAMRPGLGLAHTWLGRDERGGSLPDEVGFSPQDGRRKRGRMIRKNVLQALSGSHRKTPRLSRNTYALVPSS